MKSYFFIILFALFSVILTLKTLVLTFEFIFFNFSFKTLTLYLFISLLLYIVCLCRFDRVTLSLSTMPISPTPALLSKSATGHPRPPAPIIKIFEDEIFF